MSLSLTDLFVLGLGLDLAGAVLIARHDATGVVRWGSGQEGAFVRRTTRGSDRPANSARSGSDGRVVGAGGRGAGMKDGSKAMPTLGQALSSFWTGWSS
jgi:hypothetical protein